MSGFDDNPFGEPTVDNPFADPSVQSASGSGGSGGGGSGNAASLDDYNPFDKQKTSTAAAAAGSDAAVMPTSTQEKKNQPPPYNNSAQQQISTADFQRRQEELEKRARELERREAELRNAPYNARTNNWPPIPGFCPFQPCFYQDINVDIPVEFQKFVTYLYYMWIAHVSLLIANLVIGLLFLFAKGDSGQTFGLALFYLIIFTPASFLCWFRPVYKAFRDDSSFNFMVFFFVFFFQFLMTTINALGIGSTGSCHPKIVIGLIMGIGTLTNTANAGFLRFVGVLMIIASIAFAVMALADFLMLVRVHRLYRGAGGSMAKAQAEFTSGVMKNETVQRAAADAAQAQVRNAFSQPQGEHQGGGGGIRY